MIAERNGAEQGVADGVHASSPSFIRPGYHNLTLEPQTHPAEMPGEFFLFQFAEIVFFLIALIRKPFILPHKFPHHALLEDKMRRAISKDLSCVSCLCRMNPFDYTGYRF